MTKKATIKLIADRELYCGAVKQVSILHPPPVYYPDISNEDIHSLSVQGFTWHPNGVVFDSKTGFTWLTAYEAAKIEVQADTEVAIVVPIEVPNEGYVCVPDEMDEEDDRLFLTPGHYKMLFELRDMTDEEFAIEKYSSAYPMVLKPTLTIRPEICTLTFVSVKGKVKPQVLRFLPGVPVQYQQQIRNGSMKREELIPDELIMFDTPLEQHSINKTNA